MKAVRLYAKGDLRVEDITAPGAPAEGAVRLRVTAAGICGSDLHARQHADAMTLVHQLFDQDQAPHVLT